MRIYSEAAQAALDAGTALAVGAVQLSLSPTPWRVWGGHGPLSLPGVSGEPFQGLGDRGLVAMASGQLGSAEQGAELSLSGVNPDVLALIDTAAVRGASAVIWELLFDQAGVTLLAVNVALRGRCDRMPREAVVGGAAVQKLMIEGAVRGLGRRSARLRSDADQRLIDGTDGGMRRVSHAGEKQLNWGGKPPQQASSALPTAHYAGTRYLGTY